MVPVGVCGQSETTIGNAEAKNRLRCMSGHVVVRRFDLPYSTSTVLRGEAAGPLEQSVEGFANIKKIYSSQISIDMFCINTVCRRVPSLKYGNFYFRLDFACTLLSYRYPILQHNVL